MERIPDREEDTLNSLPESLSGLSDLSAMENATDELGRKIYQHGRERLRLNSNPNERHQQPFWRARDRPRTADAPDTKDAKAGSDGSQHGRTVSTGSNESDPPYNVPREWGKKGRKRADWLRRNESPESEQQPVVQQEEKSDEDAIIPRKTAYTGDDSPIMEWVLKGDSPRQSSRTTPTKARLQRHVSSPSSMQHMNTTLYSGFDFEDQDLTSGSLLHSTPALNQRNRKVDLLVKEEIEKVDRQAVTRRTLRQMSEQNVRREQDIKELDAGAIGVIQDPLSRRSSQDAVSGHPKRNGHERQDSIDFLKRLAKVSSNSSSPANASTDNLSHAPVVAKDRLPLKRLDFSGLNSTAKAPERHVDLKSNSMKPQAPHVANALLTRKSDPVRTEKPVTKDIRPARAKTLSDNDHRRVVSEPTHPRSALEAIVQEARETQDLGDSTINDLQEIADHSKVSTSPPPLSRDSADLVGLSQPFMGRDNVLVKGELDRKQEDAALGELNRRLQTTQTTVHNASDGLRRIEDQLESLDVTSDSLLLHAKPFIDHNGRTICDHCGGSYTSVWRGLWVEFRENFYTWDASANYKLRPTWFGITVMAWWIWLALETTLCSQFCSYGYAGADSVLFPFVIPTLLLRPLRPLWRPIIDVVAIGFDVIWGLFGNPGSGSAAPRADAQRFMKGHDDWIAAASTATAAVTRRITQSVIEAVDEVGSMWDDEVVR